MVDFLIARVAATASNVRRVAHGHASEGLRNDGYAEVFSNVRRFLRGGGASAPS